MAMTLDYCVVGGGIVGMATAMSLLQRRPGASLVILEKEGELARHQTGHNSGVIHSGIYYAHGSLKAELCKKGAQATKDFCQEHPGRLQSRNSWSDLPERGGDHAACRSGAMSWGRSA